MLIEDWYERAMPDHGKILETNFGNYAIIARVILTCGSDAQLILEEDLW